MFVCSCVSTIVHLHSIQRGRPWVHYNTTIVIGRGGGCRLSPSLPSVKCGTTCILLGHFSAGIFNKSTGDILWLDSLYFSWFVCVCVSKWEREDVYVHVRVKDTVCENVKCVCECVCVKERTWPCNDSHRCITLLVGHLFSAVFKTSCIYQLNTFY